MAADVVPRALPRAQKDHVSMKPTVLRCFRASALALALWGTTKNAHAEPLPATLVAGAVTVSVQSSGTGSIATLRRGDRILATTELPTLEDVSIEPAQSAGRALYLFRGRGAAGSAAGILDLRATPHWIWIGRTDMRGDPGERVANVVEARDVDGDARLDLIVAQQREGVSLCSESSPHALFARAVDRTGALRPVRAVTVREGLPVLTATGLQATLTSRFDALRPRALSSAVGTPEDARLLSPPFGMSDGSGTTGWAEGRGEGGAGEFVRFDWSGPPITAVIVEGGPAITLAREFILELDATRFLVSIPEGVARARIELPAPASARCLSLSLSDESRRPNDAHLGFAEVRVYTTAESEEGLAALVDRLVEDGSEGDRASAWLRAAGPDGVHVVASAWERLGVLGRRRAIGLARAQASHPDAVAILDRGAVDPSAEVRVDAIGLLSRSTEGRVRLAVLATDEAPGADERAHSVLVARDAAALSAITRSAIEAALSRPATLESAPLRSLLAARLAADEGARTALATLPAEALAALATGAATLPTSYTSEEKNVVIQWASAAATRAEMSDFSARYRIAHALVGAATSAETDAWLEAQARHAEEWMMRAEALRALGDRASSALLSDLDRDTSPRVRLAVAELRAAANDEAALSNYVAHDPWPLVRVFALGRLPDSSSRRDLVVRLLNDPASAMRASALTLIHQTGDGSPNALEGVAHILEDTREWPHVTERAIGAASALCTPALGPSLVRVVRRGAAGDAAAADLDNAQAALRVALQLGGESAAAARRAASEGASATVFAPLLEHPVTPCGASDSLPTPE